MIGQEGDIRAFARLLPELTHQDHLKNAQCAQDRGNISTSGLILETRLSIPAQSSGTNGSPLSAQSRRPPISPPKPAPGTEPRPSAAWLALGPGLQLPLPRSSPLCAPDPLSSQTLLGRNPGNGYTRRQGMLENQHEKEERTTLRIRRLVRGGEEGKEAKLGKKKGQPTPQLRRLGGK